MNSRRNHSRVAKRSGKDLHRICGGTSGQLSGSHVTLGRISAYVAILGVSLAFAGWLGRRHPRHARHAASGLRSPGSAAVVTTSPKGSELADGLGATAASAPPSADSPTEVLSEALCPEGMVWVGAKVCAVYQHRCAKREGLVCRAYEPAVCRSGQNLRFCIDRFEYPNIPGMLPAAVVTFAQARTACEEEGKRLCTEAEWALACEGERGLAYPYGNDREDRACNVGQTIPALRPEELWDPRGVSAAVSRVDRRVPSGATERCTSPFGVRDLIGNIEEWVSSDASGFHGALRGGQYTDADPTCRTVREMHDPSYRSFHTGFRCCRAPLVRPARRGTEELDGPK